MALVDFGAADQISEGGMAQFEVAGSWILVSRVGGKLFAVDAVCPHRGAFLGQGTLAGSAVRCPWHEWEFDITTGEGITNPMSCLRQYVVSEDGGRVVVEV